MQCAVVSGMSDPILAHCQAQLQFPSLNRSVFLGLSEVELCCDLMVGWCFLRVVAEVDQTGP